jgi:hypothetical protein
MNLVDNALEVVPELLSEALFMVWLGQVVNALDRLSVTARLSLSIGAGR